MQVRFYGIGGINQELSAAGNVGSELTRVRLVKMIMKNYHFVRFFFLISRYDLDYFGLCVVNVEISEITPGARLNILHYIKGDLHFFKT